MQNNESIDEALTNGYNLISSATPKSDVGSYSILLESDTSTNYNVNFQEGVLTITKAPLKLTIDSYTRVYGDENPLFKLNFTGLKNGEITPKWDKAPSLTTEATKLSNVGVYPITASCEPHNYDITSIENGTLTITPAPLKIISNNYSREYFTKNPVFDYKAEGFRNGDSKSSIRTPPTFKSSAELSSDCGQYPIIPSGASAMNYDITYESGVLTITPASLTVQAEDKSREYGDENPILGFNIVGLKGTDTASSALQEMPILSSTATVMSNVGQYPITITGGKSKNYTLSYRSGVLNVTKAPLSVMVGNAERTYGEANPAFTRSYLGFKLNDTETTAFSVLPKLSCLASRASNVGDYPIEVSGGTAHNYEIVSYGSGVLTITQATAILTVNNVGRLYFEANPQFDFTLSGLKNGDTKACVTTLPSYNCEAVKTSNAGTYSIVPANAFAKNYSFEYKSGELVVNQRPLTASIGSYTRIYGTENPDFEISYSGFVNNEDSNALNRLPDINCSAGLTSNVGKYPISLSGGEAVNYYFSKYNNGTLTIEKANQSITWDQDLSNIDLYSQVRLEAKSDADLPITYEMSPNNVATLYSNAGDWYLDCFGSGAINIRAIQNGDNNHNAASMVSKTLVVYGNGGDDPSNPQIFLNVETPGSLPSMIAENRKYQIKNLRLTGNLNGTDINFIREMAGSDSNGSTTPGVLEILDISGCTIVSGGRSYYKSNRTSDYTVGDYIFYNCKVLTTLRLPDNSISINDCAFADCDRLSVISISNSVESIGNQAFKNNISLLRIPMPINLKSIGDMAFYGCNGLTELDIPASVSLIGDGVVQGCQNLAKINVETGNSHYASIDGILYDSAFEELIIFPVNHKESEYKVYRSVTRIAPFAFFNAKDLKVINLPATVTSIGKDAFKGCVNLSILQVEAITPPVCQNDCFENISKTRCELQVPNGCKSYYWVAPVWSEFNRIIETDFSGIENIQYEKVIISIEGVKIKIHGCPDGTLIRVYLVNGLQVASQKSSSDCTEFDSLPSGVYIILIGQKSYKVTLR